MSLKEYVKELYFCERCGFCRAGCPVAANKDREESISPRGRVNLTLGLIKGEVQPSIRLAEKFYMCSTCAYCQIKCPLGLEAHKVTEAVRYELVKLNVAPPETHKTLSFRIERYNNPFGEPIIDRIKYMREAGIVEPPRKAEVLYWVGCTASYRVQSIALSTIKILRYANVDFTLLGAEEGCCGSILLRTGQRDPVVNRYAKANMEKIATKGVEALITSCAGCFRTFRKDYPEIIGDLPFEVLHSSQYIERLLREGLVRFEEKLIAKVTYHDPCHLGRHVGVYDAPRAVIEAIPGVKLVEMVNSREKARCCGAGGGLRSAFRELSLAIAADRLKLDVIPTEVRILLTTCPFCVLNLKDAASAHGLTIEIFDLTELVCRALRI